MHEILCFAGHQVHLEITEAEEALIAVSETSLKCGAIEIFRIECKGHTIGEIRHMVRDGLALVAKTQLSITDGILTIEVRTIHPAPSPILTQPDEDWGYLR